MNHAQALSNLVAATRGLAAVGIRAFLVDGTLLGAIRESRFMDHDLDVDLGVFIEEWSQAGVQAMRSEGFQLRKTRGRPDLGLEVTWRRSDVKVDLFMYYRGEGTRYHAAWPKKSPPIQYAYADFELAPLEFLGHQFLAPADPVAFLETKYGAEWRIPVTTPWDWRWGPKNAKPWPVPT